MSIKTIFLDRDGVINMDIGYLHEVEKFIFINGIFDTCRHFKDLGYEIIIVTNQSGIHRKLYSENDYQKLTAWMVNKFKDNDVDILDIFHCPHGPESKCSCRKPRPGMLIQAKKKYGINLELSWMIGDSERDITAANLAGIKNTILVKSGNKIVHENSQAKYQLNSIKDILNVVKF